MGGGTPVVLPRLTQWDSDPHPSPDGKRLVFTGTVAGKPNVFIVNVDGGGLRQRTRAGGYSPVWSSRGEIAYSDGDKIWRLTRGGRRVYVATGDRPDWSPSGRSIAYLLRRSVYRVRTSGGARRRLVHRRAGSVASSPDGQSIVFNRAIPDDLGGFFTASSRDGSGVWSVAEGGEVNGSVWLRWGSPSWQPLR